MKIKNWSLLLLPFLLLLWSTLIAAPFRYFAWVVRDAGNFLVNMAGGNSNIRILISYSFTVIIMILLFIVRRSEWHKSVTAVCSIASVTFFVIKSGYSTDIPMYFVVGLIAALLVYAFDATRIESIVGDMFILSIPVMLIYDAFFVPLLDYSGIKGSTLKPFLDIPDYSPVMTLNLWGLSPFMWGMVIASCTIVPAIFFMMDKNYRR